jgi:hypothetical protein
MTSTDFARLIDAHAAALVQYARQWCGAPEDVVQEAFVKLVRQRRPPEDAVAWLYRVVRNGALDAAKMARRRQRRESAAAKPVHWFVLPDVQQIRPLANAIQVRFRSEVALRRFDDAIQTAKTMFAISRHMSEHPTLIGNLVGIATANLAIGALEEMLEQPGCPNVYWALTNLPIPLVPLDKGMGGERALVLSEFRDLDESDPMSADKLRKFIAHMDRLLGVGKPSQPGTRAWSGDG